STKTGQKIAGPVTSWQTPDGRFIVEHVAACNKTGDLLVFWWTVERDWQCVNLSVITKRRLTSPPTSWQTADGQRTVEHLAAGDAESLLVTYWILGELRTLRIRAVAVADDDGGRPANITPLEVAQWVDKANEIYGPAGIQFLFNPNRAAGDWSL